MRTIRSRQKGLSLVELMVALLIGVILTSGVISVYITSKASYSMNTGLGQVQEAGRFALQTLQPILVMGGNLGCKHYEVGSGGAVLSSVSSTDEVYKMQDPVYGFEYTGTGIGAYLNDSTGAASNSPTVDNTDTDWTPALSTSPLLQAALAGYAVKYSDVLMVHEMLANPASIIQTTSSKTSLVYATTDAPAMAAGEIMLFSNCSKQWNTFDAGTISSSAHTIATAGSGTPGGTALTTDPAANPGGSAGPVQTYIFFVGKSPIDGGTSLFETYLATSGAGAGQLLATPIEIVPGVENMQLLYGVDTISSGGAKTLVPDTYETADAVTDWTRVASVRVALLVHSEPNAVDAAPSATTAIHMLGTGFTDSFSYRPYADRRMRRYFAQTFSFRNALP